MERDAIDVAVCDGYRTRCVSDWTCAHAVRPPENACIGARPADAAEALALIETARYRSFDELQQCPATLPLSAIEPAFEMRVSSVVTRS